MQTGQDGENMAAGYLLSNGYQILERNYRYKRAEIDLIAKKESTLIFIEVKTRTGSAFGFPEQFVDTPKRKLILMAADNYTFKLNWDGNVRFDIISILNKDLIHFEDAFY